ncbi:MAG TPA: hypothetical protein VF052_03185 [Solirubrobacterales bacterium]
MTESKPALADAEEAIAWTCARCEMTVSFAPEVRRPRLPTTWAKQDGLLYCLSCRRDMAGEAGLEGIDEDTPNEKRLQIRSQARIAFEINRDPGRPDNQIAKACRTSTVAVRKARARLGLESQRLA